MRVGNVAYCGLGIVARYRPARIGYVNEKLLKYYSKLLTAFEKWNVWNSISHSQVAYASQHLLVQSQQQKQKKRCEICSKLTVKTTKRQQWRLSGVFIIFEHIHTFY